MIDLSAIETRSGVYRFVVNGDTVYVGSSYSVYHRMTQHRSCIINKNYNKSQSKLYKFLIKNDFEVVVEYTDDYKELEQELIDKYHPKFNKYKACTGIPSGTKRKNYNEYMKLYMRNYKKKGV